MRAIPEAEADVLQPVKVSESSDESGWRIEIVRDVEQFRALHDEWNDLLRHSVGQSVFRTWEWLYTWWEEYAQGREENQLYLLIVRRNQRAVAISPTYIRRSRILGKKVRELRMLGTEMESSDYLGFITDWRWQAEATGELLDAIRRLSGEFDLVRFANVADDDPLVDQLARYSEQAGWTYYTRHHRVCPYISLEGDYEQYISSLSKNMRYNVRRRTRKLFESRNAQFDVVRTDQDLAKNIDELFVLHQKRWDQKEGRSIFDPDMRERFHQLVAPLLLKHDMLRLFTIKLDDRIAAMLYGFEYGGELTYYQAGFDPDYDKYSIGLVLLGKCIEYSFAKGLKRFDFMRGGEEYKLKWTGESRNLLILSAGVSRVGKTCLVTSNQIWKSKEGLKRVVPKRWWAAGKQILFRS